MVNDFGASGDELQEIVNVKSVAAGGLFKWVTNTLNCYDINKNVEPLRQRAITMKKAKEKGERELAETKANLAVLNEMLAKLNAELKIKKDEMNELERQSKEMTRKLNAASQLITGLGSEQKRWTIDMKLL